VPSPSVRDFVGRSGSSSSTVGSSHKPSITPSAHLTGTSSSDPTESGIYFGGESGQPGTLITLFPWPGAPRGRYGAGQATTVSFSVSEGSLGWWREHLHAHAVEVEVGAVATRADEEAFSVRDPDGLALELVAHTQPELASAWEDGLLPLDLLP
jgi:glyoxalase family protein